MITLNQEACNHCLLCQAICPNYVFSLKNGGRGKQEVELTYPDQCCECWQCVAICPRDALFSESVQRGDFEQLMSVEIPPDAMRSLLLSRRSIRAYKPDEPPDEMIKRLLEVATQAATSSNGQTEGFLVIRDKKFLGELEQLVIQAIWNAGLKFMEGRTLNKLIIKFLTKKYGTEMVRQYRAYFLIIKHRRERNELRGMIFRNAPVVIVAHGLKMNDLAQTNCALAIRSMEVLALSMGLGTCSVGFLTVASRKSRKINKFLDLPKDRTVYATMMVGYPQYKIKKVPARKPRDVRWI
jgi:nitroreductase/NAD-dependent dihydropyrimidine dehydrogenase PreA subunit